MRQLNKGKQTQNLLKIMKRFKKLIVKKELKSMKKCIKS